MHSGSFSEMQIIETFEAQLWTRNHEDMTFSFVLHMIKCNGFTRCEQKWTRCEFIIFKITVFVLLYSSGQNESEIHSLNLLTFMLLISI